MFPKTFNQMKQLKNIIQIAILAVVVLAITLGEISHLSKQILRTILIIWIFISITNLFYRQVYKVKIKDIYKNLVLSFHAILFVLFIGELVFTFLPQIHRSSHTVTAENWYNYYWHPVNKLGFRDIEIDDKDLSKKKVFFVGDSFTAGHGIKNIHNRFTDLFGEYNEEYEIFNISDPGIDSEQEFDMLINYPVKPDILVLQYFGNDIDRVAAKHGMYFPDAYNYENNTKIVEFAARGSALINYLYWSLPRVNFDYTAILKKSYNDHKIFAEHCQDLQKFIDYSHENHCKMIVLMMPFLTDLDASDFYMSKIEDFFRSHGVNTIDVSQMVEDLSVKQRIVNKMDAHASEEVNRRIARELIFKISHKHVNL